MAHKNNTFEIVYSRQTQDFLKGKTYSNPRFFTTPRSGVTKVYIAGHWPDVERAYKAIGVPVEYLDEGGLAVGEVIPVNAPMQKEPEHSKISTDYSHVNIEDGWRDLPWVGNDSIRVLATQLSETPILNKSQAVATIMAELARREGSQPSAEASDV